MFRNFAVPINLTNPTQSRPKSVGSDFNWVGLGCKRHFFPLLGWVAGSINENPKQLDQAELKR